MTIDRERILESLDQPEAALLGEEMRSIVLDRGVRTPRVTVLLHGLTASPRTWREFARVRHERGENVLVPRLPRHGHADRMSEALAGLTSEELLAQGARILDAAAQLGEEIVLVGHSLGGSLALHVAHHDARVDRVVAVAPFLGLRLLPRDWHAWARAVLEKTPNRFLYWNPIDKGRGVPEHGYHRYTTRSLAAGLALADALREDARTGPPRGRHIEIVRNAGESSVNNRAIDDLVARWRAAGGEGVRVLRVLGLGRSHDIVEPERTRAPAGRFLPMLHAILDAPPAEADATLDATA